MVPNSKLQENIYSESTPQSYLPETQFPSPGTVSLTSYILVYRGSPLKSCSSPWHHLTWTGNGYKGCDQPYSYEVSVNVQICKQK